MTLFRCSACGLSYPENETPHLCPRCGGVFDMVELPIFLANQVDDRYSGMWRYKDMFGLPSNAPVITLGEGSTPLIRVNHANLPVWLKLESLNPTGSYKDRGSAVLVSQLAARGIHKAVEDSSGNAGASYAAYAARAGIQARVFVPAAASGPKRYQIEAYGAELVSVPGPRSAAAEAVLAEVSQGAVYASHAYLPFSLPGIATIAYEIIEQLKGVPGTVIAPVGHGGLFLGVAKGFMTLKKAGQVSALPHFVGVQARACAPVWLAYTSGLSAAAQVDEGLTAAEGVRVRRPVRIETVIQFVQQAGGQILSVDEDQILPAHASLARMGVHVEPTSSLVWAALQKVAGKVPEPIVLILSGSGLKYVPITT